jgi:hypothetical protein
MPHDQEAKAEATTLVMARAYTRAPAHPDMSSGQTHDGYGWLNEEDGEEDVFRNGPDVRGCRRPPAIALHEGWNTGGKNDTIAEHYARNRDQERGTRLTRVLALRGGAAGIGPGLCRNAFRIGAVRITLVHRALASLGAAGHARLGGR